MPPVDVEERGGPEAAGEASWRPTPVLRRATGRRDRTQILVAVTLGVIALAIVKPWGLGVPLPAPAAAAPTAALLPAESTPPIATPGPVISDRNAMNCLVHQTEQVLTLERWPDREIKSWSQPDDGVVTISSGHVVGIGVCPGIGPVSSTEPNPEPGSSRDPLAWSAGMITDVQVLDGATYTDLGRPARITVQADYVAAGLLYGAPVLPAASPAGPLLRASPGVGLAAWRAGRYRITYFFPGDPDQIAWNVVVEITTPLHDG